MFSKKIIPFDINKVISESIITEYVSFKNNISISTLLDVDNESIPGKPIKIEYDPALLKSCHKKITWYRIGNDDITIAVDDNFNKLNKKYSKLFVLLHEIGFIKNSLVNKIKPSPKIAMDIKADKYAVEKMGHIFAMEALKELKDLPYSDKNNIDIRINCIKNKFMEVCRNDRCRS